VSARGETHRAGHAREVDVQTRDEETAAVRHASMVPHGATSGVVARLTRPGCYSASIAARMRATDSSSGVTDVSMTSSARAGGSYGSLTPVNPGISPARALA
jgi:hypothetical protein